jgi:hypothetical protein
MIKWVRGTLMLLAIEECVCNEVGENSQWFFAGMGTKITEGRELQRIFTNLHEEAGKNKILTGFSVAKTFVSSKVSR